MADGTTTIDDLQIEIDVSAENANKAIGNLVKKLDRLQTSLKTINGSQLVGIANGVDKLGKSMQVMNTIKTADFTRLATNLAKLGDLNVSGLNSSASSLSHLSRALNTLNGANFDNKNLQNLINSVTRLSNANVGNLSNVDFSKIGNSINQLATSLSNAPKIQQSIISMTNAVSNLSKFAQNIPIASSSLGDLGKSLNAFMSSVSSAPSVSENVIYFAQAIGTLSNAGTKAGVTAQNLSALGVGLVDLMTTLSKAPNVNKNIIDMTNALANLATQGAKVGSASKSIEKGLNRANNSAKRTSKSFGGLASAIGRFYATYFMVIRGIKGLYKSIEGTADYLEAFNYFNVALGKIGSDWSHQFEQYGYESAEAYADSFSTRLQSSLKNLSGLQISVGADENGLLTETGLKNLGLNIQEITQYASQLASVTNSVGQVGEVSLAAANSLTKLGADLSSLFNLDYSSVMNNLQSGLIGQSRALYKYGIDITNATLQTYAYDLGLEKAVSEMTQAEKMQLRMIAILDQSKVSWGDLANTINSPSNMIRQFKNNLKEVGMVLGQLFIPLMQKVMPVINGVTIALKRLLVSIAGFLGIQLDLSSFGQVYSGLGEDVDGLTDSLNDATASAKKLKSVTLGIDELNINAPQEDTGKTTGGVGGGIDLTNEILEATSEYEKVWEDAFNNMENKAQEFANKIAEIFKPFANIILEDLSNIQWEDISKNLSEFFTVVSPYAENFGQGLLNFLEDIGDISVDAINELFGENGAITNITEWLNKNDPKKAEKWGYAFGVLSTAFIGFSVVVPIITKMASKIILLVKGIKTFAGFASSAATKIGLFVEAMSSGLTISESLAAVFGGSASTIAAVGTAIAGIGSIVVGAFAAISSFVSMLTDKFSWLKEIIMVVGIALVAVGAIILGAPALVTGIIAGIVAAVGTLVVVIKDNWSAISEFFVGIWSKITSIWETATGWFNDNVIIPLTTFFEGFKERISQVFEGLWIIVQAVWQVASTWFNDNVIAPLVEFFAPIVEKISSFFTKAWNKIKEVWTTVYSWFSETIIAPVSEAFETACEKISGFFTSLWDGIKVGVATAMNAVIGVIESAINWIVDGINEIIKGFNDVVEWGAEVIGEDAVSVDLVPKVTLGKISVPSYKFGGFPEDGWFRASKGEYFGQFDDGTSYIANNNQIEAGISVGVGQAVREAVSEILAPYLADIAQNTRETANKDLSVNIGDREIARANARGQKSLGYALIT